MFFVRLQVKFLHGRYSFSDSNVLFASYSRISILIRIIFETCKFGFLVIYELDASYPLPSKILQCLLLEEQAYSKCSVYLKNFNYIQFVSNKLPVLFSGSQTDFISRTSNKFTI